MMHEIQVILRSLAVNAPIMKDWGLSLSRPLYLSMKAEETGAFIKGLSERPVIISAGMPLKEVKKKIRNTNSEAIILRMPVKKLRDHERFSLLLQHLLDCSADAKVGAQVFFVGTFQDENLGDNTFEISISEFPEMLDDDVDVVPDAKDLSVVEEQIFSHKKCDLDCLALYAAAAFCYPKLKLQGRQEDYQKLLSTCDNIYDSWLFHIDESSVVTVANRLLFDAVRCGKYKSEIIFNRQTGRAYMTKGVFKQILAPVLDMLPYTEGKKILNEAGILILGPDLQLTSKVLVDAKNGPRRQNLVVLDATKITKVIDRDEIALSDYLK